MVKVDKLQGRLMLVVDGELQRESFGSITEIENHLARMASEDGEKLDVLVNPRIEILNVVGEILDSENHFELVVSQEDPYMGCEEVGDEFECEYKVEDTNRTFSNYYDLEEYLKELIRDGDYTVEEVKAFEIYRSSVVEIILEDVEEGDYVVELECTDEGKAIERNFGKNFYSADILDIGVIVHEEMERQLAELNVVNLKREVASMDKDDLELERILLQERLADILEEQKKREVADLLY